MTETIKLTLPGVVVLARRAGAAIMKIYDSGDSGTTRKTDESPLTLADIASHDTIIQGLRKCTP
ncbi:MAG: hypothetical protein WA632_03490, partial [Gallionella sp.]